MNRRVAWGVVVLLGFGLGACSGGDDEAAAPTSTTEADADSDAPQDEDADDDADADDGSSEVPAFMNEFDRVCTTQVGFPGVAEYEPGPGVHPVVLFEDFRGGGLVESARTLPDGWAVEQDDDFEDNSDLEVAELIACSDRTAESPTGVECEFEDDGEKTELEMVDATYELTVYAATTGELVHEETLEAEDSECPIIVTYEKGDTTYVNEPTDDQYINALKGVVEPA